MSPGRRPVAIALAASFLLHALAILRVWHDWDTFSRDPVVAWIDFPISLAYLQLHGWQVIACSLLLGGLQWAVAGALLTTLIGRSARTGAARTGSAAEDPAAPTGGGDGPPATS